LINIGKTAFQDEQSKDGQNQVGEKEQSPVKRCVCDASFRPLPIGQLRARGEALKEFSGDED